MELKKRNKRRSDQLQPPKKISCREEKERDIDETYETLRDKHGDTFTTPLLRLWAQVFIAGHHDSLEHPPALPQFKKKDAVSVKATARMSPGKTAQV